MREDFLSRGTPSVGEGASVENVWGKGPESWSCGLGISRSVLLKKTWVRGSCETQLERRHERPSVLCSGARPLDQENVFVINCCVTSYLPPTPDFSASHNKLSLSHTVLGSGVQGWLSWLVLLRVSQEVAGRLSAEAGQSLSQVGSCGCGQASLSFWPSAGALWSSPHSLSTAA